MSTTVTAKYLGRSHAVAAGTVHDVKFALAADDVTGLAIDNIKLICTGRVLADEEQVIKPGSKLMVMKCAAPPKQIRLSVREIVTGRLAPRVVVEPTVSHDDLITKIVKALLLPPCDEHTEVRIFLPHLSVLMRPDLTLADYRLPETSGTVGIFAVPCPKAPQPEHAAMIAQDLKGCVPALDVDMEPDEAALTLQELAAHAAAALPPQDARHMHKALASLMVPLQPPQRSESEPSAIAEAGAAAAAPSEATHAAELDDADADFELPPSLAEVVAKGAAEEGAAGAAMSTTPPASAETQPSSPRKRVRAPAPTPPTPRSAAASLVPTRLRTGLMPAADEPAPLVTERPLVQLLAAELEAYERACTPPSAEEWAAYVQHEENRLEERCAELIASLAPARTHAVSPTKRRPSSRGAEPTVQRGMRARERPRRSRSAPIGGRGTSASSRGRHGAFDPRSFPAPRSGACSAAPRASSASSLSLSDDEARELSRMGEATDGEHEAVAAGTQMALCVAAVCEEISADGVARAVMVDGPPDLPKGGPAGKVHRAACQSCGCRLPLTASASGCKCGGIFCAHHMHDHHCRHDHKRGHEERLREDNPKIDSGRMLERL